MYRRFLCNSSQKICVHLRLFAVQIVFQAASTLELLLDMLHFGLGIDGFYADDRVQVADVAANLLPDAAQASISRNTGRFELLQRCSGLSPIAAEVFHDHAEGIRRLEMVVRLETSDRNATGHLRSEPGVVKTASGNVVLGGPPRHVRFIGLTPIRKRVSGVVLWGIAVEYLISSRRRGIDAVARAFNRMENLRPGLWDIECPGADLRPQTHPVEHDTASQKCARGQKTAGVDHVNFHDNSSHPVRDHSK